jgi:ADP-ribosyl-[dinitrogen reductase] hydrolase
MTLRMHRSHRVAGALVGSAVGDALGAPFEFGPAGQFSARFPSPARGVRTEMCGGGSLGWEPGEFTDDTQMALLVAESLVEHGGLDEADVFDRFRTWLKAGPPDVCNQIRAVLGSRRP